MVRGGWDIHRPVEATDAFVPFLRDAGFAVEIADDLEVYRDEALLRRTTLIVQCWTEGELTGEQFAGLDRAVRAGTGFAGWHGGIVAAFPRRDYQWLTGGWFVCHPGDFTRHTLTVTGDHPITDGASTVELDTERYWVLADAHNDVLATITFPAEPPWNAEVTHPAVWTRQWGSGRVFVSTVGHALDDLAIPEIRRITERGLLWAAGRPLS
ncbi:MAG: ThuA domain-containing protein [Hamadaea sp.]|nr:ThuA domain-containing protein [Hamadaea sp.]